MKAMRADSRTRDIAHIGKKNVRGAKLVVAADTSSAGRVRLVSAISIRKA
jgi:hypothetical protein